VIVFQSVYLRVIVIVFQSVFYLEMHQNNIYILKKLFLYQHIKIISKH
jgi:hypothetical protein